MGGLAKTTWILAILFSLYFASAAVTEYDSYTPGSNVTLNLPFGYEDVRIYSDGKTYRYNGIHKDSLVFTPENEGEHRILLDRKSREVFNVGPPELKTVDSKGMEVPVKASRTNGSDYTMLLGKHVEKITFRSVQGNLSEQVLRYEEIHRSKWLKSYAIDPEGVNFTNATFTAVATGTQLWKCGDYNFSERNCFGEWKKVKDLVPGEKYTYTITPKDPGFGEASNFTDLVLKNITFSNAEAAEGDNLTVFVNVSNEGGQNASNFTVQFFVDGGQLGDNKTVAFLQSNDSVLLNETWTVPGPGPFNISAVADPPLESNGSIQEFNESNNDNWTIYDVGMYQFSHGEVNGRITLDDENRKTVFNFTLTQSTGAKSS